MTRTREDIEALIARTALGDRAAFGELYDATSAKLFGVALRILKDRGTAEDALQDIFVKVWHGADRFTPGGASPMSWLIAIARNHAIDRLRRTQAAGGVAPLDEEGLQVAETRPGPEAEAIASGERSRLDGCLAELPEDRSAAVRGAYLDGDTYQVLAERHGVPLNTMRTWLRRSLLKLKDCLTR
ncbi:sigma-70 family RNA polymerase sigma factor [Roseicyclus sp. F158]|uniref:Sigma-70 family RNA polymerase sigma factor n=1 Tax=Tropicimonas omnivorans TaxID=3075590 RepID=A0ABU3DG87_9RHOB|nr:sigma-70 family RNA polymerase sigma factor [Roseicyclus sp. F158]MDT0682697.1 sigma-70 family RNA polymerase sigma factor [Roseicyclus sp. F158]